MEKTNAQNAIVLVESGLRKLHENENIAIRKDSENGLISKSILIGLWNGMKKIADGQILFFL